MDMMQGNMEKEVPVLVKVIAVLYYIGAALGILGGLAFILVAIFAASLIQSTPLGFLGVGLFIFAAIILIAFGVLGFFIGRGLWRTRNWARIVVIILSILGLLGGISTLFVGSYFNGIFNILIQGAIAGYLLFSKDVKEVFVH